MQTAIDGRQIGLSGTAKDLEGAIQEIVNEHVGNERIVWSVLVNGQQYNEKRPHDARRVVVGDIRTLEITTMGKGDICLAFLENSAIILDSLSKAAQEVADRFREREDSETHALYLQFLGALQDFFEMLKQSETILALNYSNGEDSGMSVEMRLDRLVNLMNRMIASQKSEDSVMLADLIEFELISELKELEIVLPKVAARGKGD
ncbi:MAG: hypothetical protein JXD19_09745 [Deltaproteobacteria bacterium]|nr:hypothetical protein [Deltaproteobacteria bacterium]